MPRVYPPISNYIGEFSVHTPGPLPEVSVLTAWITRIVNNSMPQDVAEMDFVRAISHWIQFSPGAGSVRTHWMDVLWCLERHY